MPEYSVLPDPKNPRGGYLEPAEGDRPYTISGEIRYGSERVIYRWPVDREHGLELQLTCGPGEILTARICTR